MEGKGFWIKFKKCDKMIQRLSARIPIIVIPSILMKDITP